MLVFMISANFAKIPQENTGFSLLGANQRPRGLLICIRQGIPIKTSTDRIGWTDAGSVWPGGASWTDVYTGTSNGAQRAPDCTYINGQFYVR